MVCDYFFFEVGKCKAATEFMSSVKFNRFGSNSLFVFRNSLNPTNNTNYIHNL